MIKIFDVENNKAIINPNILLIPELKAVVDQHKDALTILAYINFLLHPESPYANVPEKDKAEIIMIDLKLDVSLDDVVINNAIDKVKLLLTSPTRRFFLNAKKGLETLGDYLGNASIVEGRDGNFSSYQMAYTRIGKMIQEFKVLEKEHQEEVASGIRGNQEKAYDE